MQFFPSVLVFEDFGRQVRERPISSEKDLENYERFGMENYARDIIRELCKIPAARDEFHLGDGVWFDNHANGLDPVEAIPPQTNQSSSQRPKPDQFCVHRVNGDTSSLLTTVEYKPPHKSSVENLRKGLRPMNFWKKVVSRNSIPTKPRKKLRYNAELLTGSVITQEYHVMTQEGLEYSYVTNGLALVLLHVPYDDPTSLYYHLCVPSQDVNPEDYQSILQPTTAIARVLCLCLMSFHSRVRDQEWRNEVRAQLPIWKTSFDHTRSQIPDGELRQNPLDPESSDSDYTSYEPPTSEYQSSSSSVASPTAKGRQVRTQSRHASSSRYQHHSAQFCTQQCLLGLQQGGQLDDFCPNVMLHRQGADDNRHCIDSAVLVQQSKQQLDDNIDRNCTPMGGCGASGVPFKVTCAAYGYTVLGKGTTSWLWPQVSREAEVYSVLQQTQGSAVPVFLGAINLAKIYFLHSAGEIRHMLLMAWGGECVSDIGHYEKLRPEIKRSKREIRSLGVLREDIRPDNILWNAKLGRALIIDFHLSTLDSRRIQKRMRQLKS